MSNLYQPNEELRQLAATLCGGTMPADQLQRLEECVAGDPDAIAYLVDLLNLDAELHWLVAGHANSTQELASANDETPTVASRWHRGWRATHDLVKDYTTLSLTVAGLVTAIIVLSMALIVPDWKRIVPGVEVGGPSVEFVAHITHFEMTTWDKTSDGNLINRDLFIDDKLILKEGLAEITYDTGVQVILEGPVVYQISGSKGGRLDRGRLAVTVENDRGRGFTVVTPTASIVDVGTQFVVEVLANNATRAAVLEGRVSLTAGHQAQPVELLAGEKAEVTPTGTISRSTTFSTNQFFVQMPNRRDWAVADFNPPWYRKGYLLGQDAWGGSDSGNVQVKTTDNQSVLSFHGHSLGDVRHAFKPLGGYSIDNAKQATMFLRFNATGTRLDTSFGLSAVSDPDSHEDFSVQFELQSGETGFMLSAHDGDQVRVLKSDLPTGVWYRLWAVVDQPSDSYDIWLATGPDSEPVVVGSGLRFRTATRRSLVSFYCRSGGVPKPSRVLFDDIYVQPGSEISDPTRSAAGVMEKKDRAP